MKLVLLEEWRCDRGRHEVESRLEVLLRKREVILHKLFMRRTVIDDTEIVHAAKKIIFGRVASVRREEHVLVKMRQAVVFRRLGKGAVLDRDLDRQDRKSTRLNSSHR